MLLKDPCGQVKTILSPNVTTTDPLEKEATVKVIPYCKTVTHFLHFFVLVCEGRASSMHKCCRGRHAVEYIVPHLQAINSLSGRNTKIPTSYS